MLTDGNNEFYDQHRRLGHDPAPASDFTAYGRVRRCPVPSAWTTTTTGRRRRRSSTPA